MKVTQSCLTLWPHGLYNPWNSSGPDTGVGRLSLLQGIFPSQESNPGIPHCRWILYQLSHKGSPRILEWVAFPFSRGSSWPRNWTGVSFIPGGFFTNGAIREAMTKLDSILKSRDITLPTKFCLVKAMVFPVVMYRCESWTIKKAECQRIDAFELWCWRRLLRVPWAARRYNQSILKEISPQYSLEGLMLKLKLQYFGHLMWRTDSLEKILIMERLKAGGEGNSRGWDDWMASPTWWTCVWASSGNWW